MFARLLAAGTAAMTLALSPAQAKAQDSFEGETIRVIINLGAGGATGVMAQLVSRYWSDHLEGNPDFVVDSVTGGGQLRGIIEARNAAPDGRTLAFVSWSAPTRRIGPPEQDIDWSQFDVIGGMGAQAMTYMRRDVGTGVERPEDIVEVEGVRIGGYRPGSYLDLMARLSLDLLEVEHDYTTGFGGGADIVAALQRDEVNLHTGPAANYFGSIEENVVEEGIGIPMWYFPLTGPDGAPQLDEAFGDIPSFHELYETLKGEAPSGPLWESLKFLNDGAAGMTWFIAAPAGVDEARLEALRDAFAAATQDPGFLREAEEITGLVPTAHAPRQMLQFLEELENVDPEVASTLQEYIETGTN